MMNYKPNSSQVVKQQEENNNFTKNINADADKAFKDGVNKFKTIDAFANDVANDVSSNLVERIVKQQEDFNLTTALLASAKTLSHLVSFMYDTEDEFLNDIKKARTCITSEIIPMLCNPTPCGLCSNCKNGDEQHCINPSIRGDYTTTRFLAILANMLIEYDVFNKIIFMFTNNLIDKNINNLNSDDKIKSNSISNEVTLSNDKMIDDDDK